MGDALATGRPAVPNYGIDSDRLVARDSVLDAMRRRWDGRYSVDEFGGDPHLQDFLLAPVVGRIPVHVVGGEHIPAEGAALLVANRGPAFSEPLVLSGAVQRTVGRRLRLVGMPTPPLLGVLTHKLGGVGRRAGDVAAVLRAGHLAAAPLAMSLSSTGAGEAPRAVIGATLGFPLLPVAVRPGGPVGLPVRPWAVSVGEALFPPEGTEPGDPLAAAELAEEVRAEITRLLRGEGPVG
jgi:1-acyl-sn-glycerol-3-phosphate acyltransferase